MPDQIAGRRVAGLHRRLWLGTLLGACAMMASLPVQAQTPAPNPTPPGTATVQKATTTTTTTDQAGAPAQTVDAFETALLSIMKAGKSQTFLQRFNTLAPTVDRTFDLQTILKNSVGLQWASLPADQRASLLKTFRRYTIASWVANFDSWSGQQFKVMTNLQHVDSEVVVPTQLVPKSGSPTNLNFVMRQSGGSWKVVDVLADGSISRVAVQRSDFRSLLANGGVPALMASLQKKITSLSDGSLA